MQLCRYELRNVLRSKWLYAYTGVLFLLCSGMSYIADDSRKTVLSLSSVLLVIVPLVSILFSSSYWYSSEPFTTTLLAQPISRSRIFFGRVAALVASLAVCLFLGIIVPTFISGAWNSSLLWLLVSSIASSAIFALLGSWIATLVADRMWGIGLALAVWFYAVALHDALILLLLYWFREYPLDTASAFLCALNPIDLLRVTVLMHFDAALLLGHAGALIRRWVETGNGLIVALIVAVFWILGPMLAAWRRFLRKDF